jgi:hypothetical protein
VRKTAPASPRKFKKPRVFVNEVDIRPREKTSESWFEPVLVVEHIKYSFDEKSADVERTTVEATAEIATVKSRENHRAVLARTETHADFIYNRIILARRAIYKFIDERDNHHSRSTPTADVSPRARIKAAAIEHPAKPYTPPPTIDANDTLPPPRPNFERIDRGNREGENLRRPIGATGKIRLRLARFLTRGVIR